MAIMKVMGLSKPVLLFDDTCGFCRRWIERWRQITGQNVEYLPSQDAAARYPHISAGDFQNSVILVDVDGRTYRGAEAVFRALATSRSKRWLLWLYTHVPGTKAATESAYKLVANHRAFFSWVTHFFWGEDIRRSTYDISSSFFMRFLALIYLIAFISLGTQVMGLIGSGGILPAGEYLATIQTRLATERYWLVPSLAWLNHSDGSLSFLCWGGAFFSMLVFVGIASPLFLCLAWFFYLSLLSISGPFLSFQWDILLLEIGFLAIFFAPKTFRAPLVPHRIGHNPIRTLLKLVLFKLMFLSGFVKLASHDPTWSCLLAMRHHYETQPLPPWTAWYAHALPGWFQTASCFVVFVVEIVVPFLIFFPRRLRHAGAWILIGFQLLIIFTGNYTFFNWLAIALCLLLFDDTIWPKRILSTLQQNTSFQKKASFAARAFTALGLVAVLAAWLGFPESIRSFHIANRYGLFARMTTERSEIVLEGSNDGKQWQAYEFFYKPGDVNRRPGFVAPHQPRLDWQMWFAALGDYRMNGWLIRFCEGLLRGSPNQLKLISNNPFSDKPPLFLRAIVYEYRFTTPAERKATGAWWHREVKGLYCPVMSLNENKKAGKP